MSYLGNTASCRKLGRSSSQYGLRFLFDDLQYVLGIVSLILNDGKLGNPEFTKYYCEVRVLATKYVWYRPVLSVVSLVSIPEVSAVLLGLRM